MMKMNFKFATMMAAALVMGISSCSNDNDGVDSTPGNAKEHNVALKIKVASTSPRAEEDGTAVGKTPTLTDMTLFFVDNVADKVTLVQTANVGTITTTGQTFSNIPGGTNAIYAVGNLTKVASTTISAITSANTETQLKSALIDVKNQYNLNTPSYEHVNLYGYTTYSITAGTSSGTASMDIYPAIARIEIASIVSDQAPTPLVNSVTAYDLDGIFINNTYEEIGIDNAIYGTALAYAGNDAIWTTGMATYPYAFCNYYSPAKTGNTTYALAGGAKWAYYVAPAAKQASGDYVGEVIGGVQYDAKPIIVVKLSNLTYDPGYTGAKFDPAYITVTKLKSNGSYLDHFERGNVYDITSITFDASNLTGTPMVPPTHDCEVNVTVKPWTGVTTEPEL